MTRKTTLALAAAWGLAGALTCGQAAEPAPQPKGLSSLERKYFLAPQSAKGRRDFLKRWRKKTHLRAYCEQRDDTEGNVTTRRVRVHLHVRNKSRYPMDFTAASGQAQTLGVIRPGKKATAQIMDQTTATFTDTDAGRFVRFSRSNPRIEIPFYVTASNGRRLWLRVLLEVPIEADSHALKVAGMPKTQYPKAVLELGPQEESDTGAEDDPDPGRKTGSGRDPVQAQREWGHQINAKIGTNLELHESKHFFVYTDFPKAKPLVTACERVYQGLRRVFGVKKGAVVWVGKCTVFFFQNREDFLRFARTEDGFERATLTAGYFKIGKERTHIAVPQPALAQGREEQFVSTVVHEMGHAFLEAYANAGKRNVWLHEGVAQTCELIHNPADAGIARHKERVKGWARSGAPPETFRQMVNRNYILGSDLDGYAMAWSMVDWMIKTQPKDFRKLLDLVRKGQTGPTLLEHAFDTPIDRLQQQWLRYVNARY